MRGRSTFSLHNWKMLSKKFSLLFFLSPGWDWFDRGSTQQGTNYVSLSIVTDGVSPVLPLSFSLLFIRNNILYKNPAEGREWRTKRQKKKLDSEMPGLPMSLWNNWWQQGNVVLPLGKLKCKNKLCHSHNNRLSKSSYD